ncbi:MAG: ABC transporter permease subunit [Candidatus Devosia phytovorans]|uniref:ABC transporter permease subunit n=1 Tax=Candidatus Devosia phytovorans TaxID=3121372 RepID=A0AAJ6B043_9HYPH|nr:ABC transporter permease subunit [Devosia sp.]WEK05285.1 MAG: ABC transporter permease subunit [Devosia sp.]
MGTRRTTSFYVLSFIFAAFLLFLYGPMFCVYLLSFQGPDGGMSFPMRGFSTVWFETLFTAGGRGVGDIHNSFIRSLRLGAIVALLTMLIGVAVGMSFRRRYPGGNFVFYSAIISMIVPGIFVGFGISLTLNMLGMRPQWWYSGIGAQLTWSLPFAMLIMFIILGRMDKAFEEAATDLGATSFQRFQYVILPLILPGVVGMFMAGFTSSYEEAARAGLNIGTGNTMPMELTGLLGAATTPVMFAVGTLTTLFMFTLVIATLLFSTTLTKRRQLRLSSQHA